MTQALAVFLRCRCLVSIIERRLTNAEVQVIEVPVHGLAPRLDSDRVGEPDTRRSQPSHNLNRCCPVLTNFIEGQRQVALPGRYGEGQAKHPQGVKRLATIKLPPTKATQQILDLVESLHGSSRIINRRRQRPDADIHQRHRTKVG